MNCRARLGARDVWVWPCGKVMKGSAHGQSVSQSSLEEFGACSLQWDDMQREALRITERSLLAFHFEALERRPNVFIWLPCTGDIKCDVVFGFSNDQKCYRKTGERLQIGSLIQYNNRAPSNLDLAIQTRVFKTLQEPDTTVWQANFLLINLVFLISFLNLSFKLSLPVKYVFYLAPAAASQLFQSVPPCWRIGSHNWGFKCQNRY